MSDKPTITIELYRIVALVLVLAVPLQAMATYLPGVHHQRMQHAAAALDAAAADGHAPHHWAQHGADHHVADHHNPRQHSVGHRNAGDHRGVGHDSAGRHSGNPPVFHAPASEEPDRGASCEGDFHCAGCAVVGVPGAPLQGDFLPPLALAGALATRLTPFVPDQPQRPPRLFFA